MHELWTRLETWFAANLPRASLKLRPGARADAIEAAEARLGLRFPDDFRESLAIHDGQEDDPSIHWLPGVSRLGSLESLVDCWQSDREAYDADDLERFEWLDARGCVRQVHFHPK